MRVREEGGPEYTLSESGEPYTYSVRQDGNIYKISAAEPKGYLAACQGANGLIHLISSWNHYAFNLQWLETPMPVR